MDAIALWTWVGVLVLGVVVLGFCGYETRWKLRRLNRDIAALAQVRSGLEDLQTSLVRTQNSMAAIARQRAVNAYASGDRLFPHPKDPENSANTAPAVPFAES